MEAEKKGYYLITAITVIFITGLMGAKYLVPLTSDSLGASPVEIGIIGTLYSVFPLFVVVSLGRWVDKIGSKLPLILSTFVGGLSLLIPFVNDQLIGIYILQIILGLSQTVFAVSAQNFMGSTPDTKLRENNIAIFSIAVSVGASIGPFISGALSDWLGYGISFALLGITGLIAGLLTLFISNKYKEGKSKERKSPNPQSFSLLKIKNIRKAFLISAIILLAKEIFVFYFPLLGLEMGLENKVTGLIVSVNAAAGIIIRLLMTRLLDKYGRNTVIFYSILISGSLFVAIPFLPQVYVLFVISFLLGLGLGIGQPLSITTTMMFLPKDSIATGLGLRLSVNRLTQVITPFVFGAIANVTGYSTVFWLSGGLVMFGSLYTKIDLSEQQEEAMG